MFLEKLFFGMMFLVSVQESGENYRDVNAKLEDCILQIGNGDMDALEYLYEKTRAAVYGFAFSMMKDVHDADDVTQDVYIQVVRGAKGYAPCGKPMAWLLTITKNLARMELRQRKWIVGTDSEDVISSWYRKTSADAVDSASIWNQNAGMDPANAAMERPDVTAEDRMVLRDLLGKLEQSEREIVVLHAAAGLKHREIAAMLDMPLSTVLSKYSRTIRKLQREWE